MGVKSWNVSLTGQRESRAERPPGDLNTGSPSGGLGLVSRNETAISGHGKSYCKKQHLSSYQA